MLIAVAVALIAVTAAPSWSESEKISDTQFFLLCADGNTQGVIEAIKAGANVNAKYDGWTALMYAASKGHAEIVNALINANADINAKAQLDVTVLMIAAGLGHTEVVNTLIKAGVDVNAKNKLEATALMAAIENGHVEIVNALIKAGADINAKAKLDVTTLMTAAILGRTEIVNTLIEAGADVNAKGDKGITALMMAVVELPETSVHASIDAFIKDTVIKADSDLNVLNQDNILSNVIKDRVNSVFSAANQATSAERLQIIDSLIKAGADVNAKNDKDKTPLISAAQKGNAETVNLLLDAGADAKAKDNSGKTAFDYASENEKLKGSDTLKRLEQLSR